MALFWNQVRQVCFASFVSACSIQTVSLLLAQFFPRGNIMGSGSNPILCWCSHTNGAHGVIKVRQHSFTSGFHCLAALVTESWIGLGPQTRATICRPSARPLKGWGTIWPNWSIWSKAWIALVIMKHTRIKLISKNFPYINKDTHTQANYQKDKIIHA